MKRWLLLLPLGMASLSLEASAQTPNKVDIVKVVGCLREQGTNNWMLVAATEPEASNANAPSKDEIPTAPPAGKNEFRLIGVGEFNLPAYKDHTILVKALFIKATPVSRLNITSVTEVVSSCTPGAGK
jgi:hypothetical protein